MAIHYVFWPGLPPNEAAVEAPLPQLLAQALASSAQGPATDLRYQQSRQPVQAWLAWANERLVACRLS